ncbi:hypothetical protein [Nocardia sp. NPDC005825]|uniref:hypothetical protein n=1 Tax=unclassified Nocardia TaxID=2637762 RepID=UPI003402D874
MTTRVIVWGAGELASAVHREARLHGIDAVHTASPDVTGAADCVVVTSDSLIPNPDTAEGVLRLLESGRDVIATAPLAVSDAELASAAERGRARLYRTGVHQFMVANSVLTLAQALRSVRGVRLVEMLDLSSFPDGHADLAALGRGGSQLVESLGDAVYGSALRSATAELFTVPRDRIRVDAEAEYLTEQGELALGADVPADTTIRLTYRGDLDGRTVFHTESYWYLGSDHAPSLDLLPYAGFRSAVGYACRFDAEPAPLDHQWELAPSDTEAPTTSTLTALILHAIDPVRAAPTGVLHDDPTPRYRQDDRITEDRPPPDSVR